MHVRAWQSPRRLCNGPGRRADLVGFFRSEASIIRLIGAVLVEANDEGQMQHCCV